MWLLVFLKMFILDFSEKIVKEVLFLGKIVSEIREMLLVIYLMFVKGIDDENYLFLLDFVREYMMEKFIEKCEDFLIYKLCWLC